MKNALKLSLMIFGICGISRITVSIAWWAFSYALYARLPRHFDDYLTALILLSFASTIASAIGLWLEKRKTI
jgi:hypothetical protein